MAGGLVLGFANGVGGLLVLVNGVITDHFGLFAGVEVLVISWSAAGLLATLLPGDALKINAPKPAAGNETEARGLRIRPYAVMRLGARRLMFGRY